MSLLCKIFGHKEKWVEEERFLKEDEEPSQSVAEGGSRDDRKVQIKTPVCERCGEDLTEELMKKRLRQCGYCGTFDEPENMDSHGYFGKICGNCNKSSVKEIWTGSGEIVGMDICPRCGSRMEFETLGSYEHPDGGGTVTGTRHHCPNCRLENLGYM